MREVLARGISIVVIVGAVLIGGAGQGLAVEPLGSDLGENQLIVERDSNGVPTAVISVVRASSGWRVETSPKGELRFFDPAGRLVDTWGTAYQVGGVAFTGMFTKVDDNHIKFTIGSVTGAVRGFGLGNWLNCIGGKAREGLIAGGVAGCVGGIFVGGAGCAAGGIVGGGSAALGNTIAGIVSC